MEIIHCEEKRRKEKDRNSKNPLKNLKKKVDYDHQYFCNNRTKN